jgi:Co/Zn/Cd efflux system component
VGGDMEGLMSESPIVTTTAFRVEQMDCDAEEQLVRLRLGQLDEVEAVRVDLVTRTVSVRHSSDDPSSVRAALDGLNLDTTQLDEPDTAPEWTPVSPRHERMVFTIALLINAVFFVVELVAGLVSQSMGLVADSVDMLADASVYALSLVAIGRAAHHKMRLAAGSGYLQLALATVGLFEVIRRFLTEESLPEARTMIMVSLLALAANTATLIILRRAKNPEAHFQASWIFTANDIKANTLVILSAVVVIITENPAADLIAGAIIFIIVANGARRILKLARP